MTFLETLQSHKGGLIRLKTQLYWYGVQVGWDKNPGRICLLLDVATDPLITRWAVAFAVTAKGTRSPAQRNAVLPLIDGRPQWIWVTEEDVELI